jgi:ubiquitin-protein ligase
VPPEVYYHSGGLRINPNLYENGKVCLSLLNTWQGKGSEVWHPSSSTILQVSAPLPCLASLSSSLCTGMDCPAQQTSAVTALQPAW